MDPKAVASEPLAMLLAGRRHQYAFSWGGTGRTDRRATVMLDYKTLASPVVKAMAFGTGVSRAAHRLREGEPPAPTPTRSAKARRRKRVS